MKSADHMHVTNTAQYNILVSNICDSCENIFISVIYLFSRNNFQSKNLS